MFEDEMINEQFSTPVHQVLGPEMQRATATANEELHAMPASAPPAPAPALAPPSITTDEVEREMVRVLLADEPSSEEAGTTVRLEGALLHAAHVRQSSAARPAAAAPRAPPQPILQNFSIPSFPYAAVAYLLSVDTLSFQGLLCVVRGRRPPARR
jgi:hypothetical protein